MNPLKMLGYGPGLVRLQVADEVPAEVIPICRLDLLDDRRSVDDEANVIEYGSRTVSA